jgi:hypothetical protein
MRRTRSAWRWWTVVLRGVAAVLFGLFALFAPQVVFLSLVLLFGSTRSSMAHSRCRSDLERPRTLAARWSCEV